MPDSPPRPASAGFAAVPNETLAPIIPTPVGGVTWIWNVTVHALLPVQEFGTEGVMMIVGVATGSTLTAVATVVEFPDESRTVAVTA